MAVTRVLAVDPLHPDEELIAEAARALTRGELVAFPTETVYGLGANALDTAAVERVFRAKGRPATDPAIVHLASAEQLDEVAQRVPAVARDLAHSFWPGALTLILEKHSRVPASVTAGLPTVGVRVPSHPVAHLLIARAGVPVAAPSANRFSRPSPTSAAHVLADLEGLIDLVIDGGPTSIGVESTIVDLTVSPPVVRRPGAVTLTELRRVVSDLTRQVNFATSDSAQLAPGQLLRHYAPRAVMTLYVGTVDAVARRLSKDLRAAAAAGSRIGVLAPEEDLLALAPRLAALGNTGRVVTMRYGARRDPAESAHHLFRALRALDAEDVDIILASAPADEGIGTAIIDRLTRAAEGRVISLDE